MPDSSLSAEVLGKLIVVLQTLDILTDAEAMAAFLQPALSEVPGITTAFLCLNGEILPAGRTAVDMLGLHCPKADSPSVSSPVCMAEDRPDIQLVAIHTPRKALGCLQLVVHDKAQFEAYKPFLVNIGHMIATVLENREIDRSLAEANAQLNGLVNELEDRVQDRTRELETAEERYRTTLATLPDAISALRAVRGETGDVVDFEWTYANPAEATWHPAASLVGTRLLGIHPEYRDLGLFDAFCRVVETGEERLMEVQHAPGHLSTTFAEYRISRLDDGVVAVLRDVTDRHASAQMLAESKERYQLLAENASDVVMLLTPGWSLEWVSESVTDVLGWSPPDLIGHAFREFIHPDDLARFLRVTGTAGPENPARVEFRFRRSDGTPHWVACRTRVRVDESGAPVAVVGGLVDVADRKATEVREQERLAELELFQRLTVGRELKMIELKKEIESLTKDNPPA
jgi:PAS domain S-box-containing protein